MIELMLPFPPSVNRMWRTPRSGKLAGRTLLSVAGREYRTACMACVLEQRIPRLGLNGRLHVAIKACPPDRRARDLDNMLKGVLDSLQHCGVIENDSHIDKLEITRGPKSSQGEVWVTIENWAAV